ncbi:MAG: hypothetical protein SVP26_01200 [Chloroflexota bacterium]|nr:hypothetical protein [Chloroflexota bacterium]
MQTLSGLAGRVRYIRRSEGLLPLLRRASTFLLSRLFEYRVYYLSAAHVDDPDSLDEADYMPRIDGCTRRVVRSNEEADRLEAEGFEFRSCAINSRERLDKGAIACCLFIGRELAHIGWAALTPEARDALNEPPVMMDFSQHEAYRGGAWTHPKYRRMRLTLFGLQAGRRMLWDSGVTVVRSAVARRNVPQRTLMGRLTPSFYAEGRYLRVLCWKSWRERPLVTPPSESPAVGPP